MTMGRIRVRQGPERQARRLRTGRAWLLLVGVVVVAMTVVAVKGAFGAPLIDDRGEAVGAEVLYRVNAGGPEVDGSPRWLSDNGERGSAFVRGAGTEFAATHRPIELDPSVPKGTPASIFATERYDTERGGSGELAYEFPVSPGIYDVRLYFAEIYDGGQARGFRSFDVSINGRAVLKDYDTFEDVGGFTGVMKSFTVRAAETLLVAFESIPGRDNPRVMGIEVLRNRRDQGRESGLISSTGQTAVPPAPTELPADAREVWALDLEKLGSGRLTPDRLQSTGVGTEQGVAGVERTSVIRDPFESGHERVLEVRHERQRSDTFLQNGSFNVTLQLPGAYESAILEYDVAFGEGFQFRPGPGQSTGWGGKLPGLGGAGHLGAPADCVDTDGSASEDGGFSLRLMWRLPSYQGRNGVVGPLHAYAYHPEKSSRCGDDWTLQHPSELEAERWYAIRQRIDLNHADRSDGRLRIWVDGQLALDMQGIRMRTSERYAINRLLFHTYFGGDDPGWGHRRQEELTYFRKVRVFAVER